MLIETTRFGTLEIDERKIVVFPEGLPGFTHIKEYVIIPIEKYHPFHCMQALSDTDLAFAVADPWVLFPDYAPQLSDDDVTFLELTSAEEAAIYVMAVVPPDLREITVNLMAPLVINVNTGRGRQTIVMGNYSTREKLSHEESLTV